jgi:hypothetical protein
MSGFNPAADAEPFDPAADAEPAGPVSRGEVRTLKQEDPPGWPEAGAGAVMVTGYLGDKRVTLPEEHPDAKRLTGRRPDALGDAIHGATQGVSLGFADEAQGAIASLAQKLGLMGGARRDESMGEAYRRERDDSRAEDRAAQAASPKLYGAGHLAGSILSAGALPASRLGILAGGAAAGLGNSEADLTEGEHGGRAAFDAAFGGGAALLGGEVVRGVGAKVAPALRRFAEQRAIKSVAAGKPDLKPLLVMTGAQKAERAAARAAGTPVPPNEAEELGRFLLDEKLLRGKGGIPRSAGEAGDAAALLAHDVGGRIGTTLEEAQATATAARPGLVSAALQRGEQVPNTAVAGGEVADAIEKQALEPLEATVGGQMSGGGTKLRELIGKFRERGLMSYPQAHAERVGLDKNINWDTVNPSVAKRAVQDARRALEGVLERKLEEGAGPDSLAAYRGLKSRYGKLAKLTDLADEPATRELANNFMSLGDRLAMGNAPGQLLAGGQPLKAGLAVGAGLANKLLRQRGNAAAAMTTDAISDSIRAGVADGSLGRWGVVLANELARHGPEAALEMARAIDEEHATGEE